MCSAVSATPYRSNSSRIRCSPTLMDAVCAARSPLRSSGVRELRQMSWMTSWFSRPPRASLMGGMIVPSWYSSVDSGNEPGVIPPTSA